MANHSPVLDPVFAALADPTRRAIVARLVQGDAAVSELAAPFPIALPSVLKHLDVLERCGLVRSRKQGRVRTCALQPAALAPAGRWLDELRTQWEQRSDRLAAFAETLHLQETPDEPGP